VEQVYIYIYIYIYISIPNNKEAKFQVLFFVQPIQFGPTVSLHSLALAHSLRSPQTLSSSRLLFSPHAEAASPLLTHADATPQMLRRFPPAPPKLPSSDADIATGCEPGQLRLAPYRRPTRTAPSSAATEGRPTTCSGRRRLPFAQPPGRSSWM
jgi:hypothetical protein